MDTVPIVLNSNTIITTSREPHKLTFCVNTESVCLFAFTLFTFTTKKVIFLERVLPLGGRNFGKQAQKMLTYFEQPWLMNLYCQLLKGSFKPS